MPETLPTAPKNRKVATDPVTDYVPAEAFLEGIGYFTPATKRVSDTYTKIKTLGRKETVQGPRSVQVKVAANHELGLPITHDQDYYRAFLKICDEVMERDGRFKLPIAVSTSRLLRYAGKPTNDRNWREVREWFDRMTATLISGGMYRAKAKHYDTGFTGTVFAQVVLTGGTLKGGRQAETNYVWPSPWWLSNVYHRHVRPFDFALYRRLRKPIAKSLLTLLETGWYASGGQSYSKRYDDLAGEFLLTPHRHLSRIKQQLDPAHQELQREGVIDRWRYDMRPDKTVTLTYWPGEKWRDDQSARKDRRELAERLDRPEPTPAPVDEETEAREAIVNMLVSDILDLCPNDRHSENNWRMLVRQIVTEKRHDVIHRAMSETRAALNEHDPNLRPRNVGAYLNSRMRELMSQFDLFPEPTTNPNQGPAPRAGARRHGSVPGSTADT